MKDIQERFARELHNDLTRQFESSTATARLSVSGAGVNWRCTAKEGRRVCEINCFEARIDGTEAEYLSSFNDSGRTIVWGRTASKPDTIAAVFRWLQGSSLRDLESQFEFVDRQKRSLLKIAQDTIRCFPRIQEMTTQELKRLTCDLCEFWFVHRDRACKLSYYGKNEFADAAFHWDKCELFRFRAEDLAKLAAVINRWLCDCAKPSVMRDIFSWLDISELATYYENGRPIEGEFVMSWNAIERFYAELNFAPKDQILKMIAEMRLRGYDKTLRAGQSMFSLILSRSRRHGLRQLQPSLVFSFKDGSMEVCARFASDENLAMPEIKFSPQVDALLQRLIGATID